MNLHQDKWPEPLTKGQQYLRSVGETPDSMRLHRERDQKAQAKRDHRIERNIRNEAAQGRYPEQLECRCGAWGEVNYDDGAYRGYFCGGSERCCP